MLALLHDGRPAHYVVHEKAENEKFCRFVKWEWPVPFWTLGLKAFILGDRLDLYGVRTALG